MSSLSPFNQPHETTRENEMNRYDLATLIVDRLTPDLDDLQRQFTESKTVPSCYIDGLLPETICRQLFQAFSPKRDMMLKKSLRENKYVAAQMNKYDPLLEKAIFAFQDQRVDAVHQIPGIPDMLYNVTPDWQPEYGGNLELWNDGLGREQRRSTANLIVWC
jgi:Rps23 Pro-64 3,4-dihydroxylase Tpa1-like proline 4-hydroxylase